MLFSFSICGKKLAECYKGGGIRQCGFISLPYKQAYKSYTIMLSTFLKHFSFANTYCLTFDNASFPFMRL